MKIGIIGFSSTPFDQEKATALLQTTLQKVVSSIEPENIEIVSGYTNIGIPKIAYEIASSSGWTTVGFSAKEALTASCGLFPVHKEILVGEKFGEESAAFVDYIDILIRIGGGQQSKKEVALFKKKHTSQELSGILFEEEIRESSKSKKK